MIFDNPAIVGLIVAIPSFILGYLGFRRSQKVDKATEQAGVASANITAVNQVFEGLKQLNTSLQEDNRLLREDIKTVNTRLEEALAQIEKLREEVRRLWEKYKGI